MQSLDSSDPVIRPAWCDIAEQAAILADAPDDVPAVGSWQEMSAIALRPVLTLAADRLAGTAERHLGPDAADIGQITRTSTDALAGRLAPIAARSLLMGRRHASG